MLYLPHRPICKAYHRGPGGQVDAEPGEVVDVASGAEGLAGTGEHDGTDGVVLLQVDPEAGVGVVEGIIEGVEGFRSIQRQDGDRTVPFDKQLGGSSIGHQSYKLSYSRFGSGEE